MEMDNIVDFASRDGVSDALTDLLRTEAQQLIASAFEAELEGFLGQFADTRTAAGHAAVVHNGHHPAVLPHPPFHPHKSPYPNAAKTPCQHGHHDAATPRSHHLLCSAAHSATANHSPRRCHPSSPRFRDLERRLSRSPNDHAR
jgi:hypothetical protein